MKKRALLSIVFASTLSLCACDFDIMSLINGNEDLNSLLTVSEEKRQELIDSIQNIGVASRDITSFGEGEDYSTVSPDKYIETITEYSDFVSQQIIYPRENKLIDGYGGEYTTYQLVDDEVYVDGETIPHDDPYYVAYKFLLELYSQTFKTEYFTFGAIDTMISAELDFVQKFDPSFSSSFDKEEFMKKIKVVNKKNQGTFALVCDQDINFSLMGYDCHTTYLKYEYVDYKLASQLFYEYADSVSEDGANRKRSFSVLCYTEFSYNVSPENFFK